MTDKDLIPTGTSLNRFTHLCQPGVDRFNGSLSRDFCNSFWGPSDAGPSVVFTRLRGGSKTTDELRQFWSARRAIEEEYTARLNKLARLPVGVDEIGELRNSLDTLRIETQRQAQNHGLLASNFGSVLENATAHSLQTQTEHQEKVQIPLESKAGRKQILESRVKTSRDKYEANYSQIQVLKQQLQTGQSLSNDLWKARQKLARIKQFMLANKLDYSLFTKESKKFLQLWEVEWKEFCDSCQDLEYERLNLTNDVMWAYANEISAVCVSDAESIERMRDVLDQLISDNDVRNFAQEYGTGNMLSTPSDFKPSEDSIEQPANPPVVRLIHAQRVSKPQLDLDKGNEGSQATLNFSPTFEAQSPGPLTPPFTQTPPTSASSARTQDSDVITPSSGSTSSRSLPRRPGQALFYVKALYDYKATDDMEFDFQVGDVIAVMSTSEDGWWGGELLDERRREEMRHIFPSNFVSLL